MGKPGKYVAIGNELFPCGDGNSSRKTRRGCLCQPCRLFRRYMDVIAMALADGAKSALENKRLQDERRANRIRAEEDLRQDRLGDRRNEFRQDAIDG